MRISPLRQRLIDDMTARHFGEKTQKDYIRCVKNLQRLRVSGRMPVMICQNGPAATLAVAPFAEALKAGVPIVAIMQEVDRSHIGRNAFQEHHHKALFAPVTKWFHLLESTDGVEDHFDRAFIAAASGEPRGGPGNSDRTISGASA